LLLTGMMCSSKLIMGIVDFLALTSTNRGIHVVETCPGYPLERMKVWGPGSVRCSSSEGWRGRLFHPTTNQSVCIQVNHWNELTPAPAGRQLLSGCDDRASSK